MMNFKLIITLKLRTFEDTCGRAEQNFSQISSYQNCQFSPNKNEH